MYLLHVLSKDLNILTLFNECLNNYYNNFINWVNYTKDKFYGKTFIDTSLNYYTSAKETYHESNRSNLLEKAQQLNEELMSEYKEYQ